MKSLASTGEAFSPSELLHASEAYPAVVWIACEQNHQILGSPGKTPDQSKVLPLETGRRRATPPSLPISDRHW